MNYTEALSLLTENPDTDVVLVTRNATLTGYDRVPVWLDPDTGALGMSHPTDTGTCGAPEDGRYRLEEPKLDPHEYDPNCRCEYCYHEGRLLAADKEG